MIKRILLALIFVAPAFGTSAEQLRPDQIYEQSIGAVCTIIAASDGQAVSLGSGFIVTGDGLVATNRHVVEGASAVLVKCGTSAPHRGRVKFPYNRDIAIVETGIQDIRPLAISLANPARLIGHPVYAIGNPEGLEGTISNGLISGVRQVDGATLIQISAPISHGSSGGPVLLDNGQVIGIATAVLSEGQNLNFALPAAILRDSPEIAARLNLHQETAGSISSAHAVAGPVELGEIVKAFMRPPGAGPVVPWDVGLDTPVEWLSDGLEEEPIGTVRHGRARILVAGESMWELHKQREEVYWDITLVGWHKAVTYVDIEPQVGCFGAANSGCSYDFREVLSAAGVKSMEVCTCKDQWGGEPTVIYRLSVSGRQDATAVVAESCGSGGCSTLFNLFYDAASSETCQKFAENSDWGRAGTFQCVR